MDNEQTKQAPAPDDRMNMPLAPEPPYDHLYQAPAPDAPADALIARLIARGFPDAAALIEAQARELEQLRLRTENYSTRITELHDRATAAEAAQQNYESMRATLIREHSERVDEAVAAALAAETERCANIAKAKKLDCGAACKDWDEACDQIAAAIVSAKEKPTDG